MNQNIPRYPASIERIYIEPTNTCNLGCRTCMRHVWEVPSGLMDSTIFGRILESVQNIHPTPTLFLGGFGEPLAHPEIVGMVRAAKRITQVEMISNGTLLDEPMALSLIEAGLDRLWVSIDGATPDRYADVRLGASLPEIIANLNCLQRLRDQSPGNLPRLGIAFVAMQRNIGDLPELIRLGRRLGADRFSVTNVQPHTADLQKEILYSKSLDDASLWRSKNRPQGKQTQLDRDPVFFQHVFEDSKWRGLLIEDNQYLVNGSCSCPFLEKGSVSIRWDGAVCPCLPLLHTHQSYLGERLRTSQSWMIGNILDDDLIGLWNNPAYAAFRQRLAGFDFSPCAFCNSCGMAASNQEDCFGNELPTCGGCLWAHGFIQCP